MEKKVVMYSEEDKHYEEDIDDKEIKPVKPLSKFYLILAVLIPVVYYFGVSGMFSDKSNTISYDDGRGTYHSSGKTTVTIETAAEKLAQEERKNLPKEVREDRETIEELEKIPASKLDPYEYSRLADAKMRERYRNMSTYDRNMEFAKELDRMDAARTLDAIDAERRAIERYRR